MEEIDKYLRPILAEEDVDLSYSDEPLVGGGILIPGHLKHLPGGHYEDSFMPAAVDTTGGKSEVQGVGSTNSYLRRYALARPKAATAGSRQNLVVERFFDKGPKERTLQAVAKGGLD